MSRLNFPCYLASRTPTGRTHTHPVYSRTFVFCDALRRWLPPPLAYTSSVHTMAPTYRRRWHPTLHIYPPSTGPESHHPALVGLVVGLWVLSGQREKRSLAHDGF